ncbi:hypothetical protein GQ53DRAFT_816936 [Thozetella sp. PMI_491]|nr:hypothetical protein GQ53DRAFT_816936 [Thozetella sp. PMI_491]
MQYNKLPTEDEEEVAFLPDGGVDPRSSKNNRPSRWERFSTAVTIMSLGLSGLFIMAGLWRNPTHQQCIQKLDVWSPMLEAVEYVTTVPDREVSDLYRGIPTESKEDAWDALWKFGSLGIPDDQLPRLNKSASEEDWRYVPAEQGVGVQAFFEGFHYIHCLNLLRQYTYHHEYNYSYVHAFVNEHVPIMVHVEHCIDMLRVKLECETDTSLYPVSKVPAKGIVIHAHPERACRNFSKVVDWANTHITVPFVEGKDG